MHACVELSRLFVASAHPLLPLPIRASMPLPAQLNGAAGWLFLNHPDDIAHVCAANTRNYSERCECCLAVVHWDPAAA